MRQQRDFFYDQGHHGRDWQSVFEKYAPLVDHVRRRADLTYLLDQVSGELSVGHSFVGGGDFPEVAKPSGAALGADLVASDGLWRIERIYTFESWNPGMDAPLDRPGLDVTEDQYVFAIDGVPVDASIEPYHTHNDYRL